jgi:type II secretory pathway pseudopilin PulG
MRRFAASSKGASLLELLVAVAVTAIAVAVSAGFLSATRRTVTSQELTLEASTNLRAALDVLVRDIRLAGACLPVTGDFIALDGLDNNEEDEIWVRTGLVRPDMSCVRTTTTADITRTTNTIPVESVDGFSAGARVYIRAPSGSGESFDITGVDSANNRLLKSVSLSTNYVAGSGVYAIDERRYFINHWAAPWGDTPELMLQIGSGTPQPFAVGVERLDFQYQLRRNCPPCDVVQLPASEDEWRLVEQVLVTVRTRSDRQTPDGGFVARTASVNIKPRNLLPP